MLDLLSAIGLSTTQFAAVLALSSIVLILAYRPFVVGLLDPLNVFIIAMIADTVLMFGLPWSSDAKIEFTFFIVFFWIGFALVAKIPKNHPVITFDRNGLLELEIVLLLASIVIVVGNLYLGLTAGFPLFSANPSEAKVTTYTGGLGIIRHLNTGPYTFLCCGCALLIAVGRRTKLALALLVICSVFVAFSGSKGALLPILFVQAFVLHHKGLRTNKKYYNRIKKFAIPSFAAALAVAIAVVIRDNGSFEAGIAFLAKRMLFFGDVILFYYPRRGSIPELAGVGPLDYLHYMFDPILGMFRLVDYSSVGAPLGSIISGAETGFGPNAQYFVRADIYFGPFFGCFYCLVMGYLSGVFRSRFFTLQTKSPTAFAFSLLLAVLAFTLAIESQLFVSEVIDSVLFLVPLWFFARVVSLATAIPRKLPEAAA